eukprot:scaffold3887_cov214-Pinguiococcus_pyrenoidosus.AAC.1
MAASKASSRSPSPKMSANWCAEHKSSSDFSNNMCRSAMAPRTSSSAIFPRTASALGECRSFPSISGFARHRGGSSEALGKLCCASVESGTDPRSRGAKAAQARLRRIEFLMSNARERRFVGSCPLLWVGSLLNAQSNGLKACGKLCISKSDVVRPCNSKATVSA